MSKREKGNEIKIKTKKSIETIWLIKTEFLEKQHFLNVEIIDKVYRLCLESFTQKENPEFRKDVMKHIREEKNVCLAFEDQCKKLNYTDIRKNKAVAFASYRIMKIKSEKILYISAVVVAPSKQRENLGSSIVKCIIEKEGVDKIALRTQNPVMYESLKKVCKKIFPPLSKEEKIPEDIMELGVKVASSLGMPKYESILMTEEGTYGGHSLYGIKPGLDKKNLDMEFEKKVNISRGDSMIVIGVIDENDHQSPSLINLIILNNMDKLKEIEKLTQKLINFNTENFDDKPGGYTLALLESVKSILKKSGIKSKIYEYKIKRIIGDKKTELDRRGILISEFDPQKPVILFQGHADTVPVVEKFDGKNFKKKNNTIYGRGAVDMKSSLAGFILTLKDLKNQSGLKYQPVLLITSDEEAGNFAGIKKFIEKYKIKKFNVEFAVCGEATGFALKQNFLGAMYLKFRFTGKSGHAANNKSGMNAIEKAVPFLNNLIKYQEKLEKESNVLGKAVLNIGVIRGGEKVNKIPTECEIELTIRSTLKNNYYQKEIAGLVRKHKCEMETVFSYDPILLSKNDNFIRSLQKSIDAENKQYNKNIAPDNTMKEFTEATLLNNAGIKTIVLGPGDPLLNHTDNEHIKIRDILDYVEILTAFMKDYKNQT